MSDELAYALLEQKYGKDGAEHITSLQSEVERLRGRCGEAETENERVRQANLDVMMHFDDMKAEKDKADTKIAKLESIILDAHRIASAEPKDRAIAALTGVDWSSQAWLLRKQAEAVEAEAREWNPDDQTYSGRKPHKEMIAYAQRLRQKADEAEKTGR